MLSNSPLDRHSINMFLNKEEEVFNSLQQLNRIDLLDKYLTCYLRSGLPPLPKNVFQKKYKFTDLGKFNALRATVKYERVQDFNLIIKKWPGSLFLDSKNSTDSSLYSIIHYIAYKGNLTFLEIFFKNCSKGALKALNILALPKLIKESSNKKSAYLLESALSYALKSGSPKSLDCVRLLIANQASVNTKNGDGKTPIMVALEKSNSIEVIKTLEEAGAEISDSILPLKNKIVTFISKNYSLSDNTMSQYIELLAKKGVNLNAYDSLNTPLIQYTCDWDNRLSTKTLISFGVDVPPLDRLFREEVKLKKEVIRLLAIRDSLSHLILRSPLLLLKIENPLKIVFDFLTIGNAVSKRTNILK